SDEKSSSIRVFFNRDKPVRTVSASDIAIKPRPKIEEEKERAIGDRRFLVKLLDFIVMLGMVMIFFGLPLFFTGLAFQGVVFEKQMYFYFWLFLALVAWTAKGVLVGEMRIRRTALDIPIIAFWAVYLLATLFSVDRWHSFWGAFGDPSRGLASATAVVIAYYLIRSYFNLRRFSIWLMALEISGFILSLWSVAVIFNVQLLPTAWMQLIPLSLVGSISGLAILAGAMLPLIITLIFKLKESQTGKIWKIVLMALLVIHLAANLVLLLALYAFVPWIGLLIGMGFFLIYILSKIVRPAENLIWIPMVCFVAVLAFLMIGNNKLAKADLPVDVIPSNSLSFAIAKNTLKEKFILGSGPATYGYDFSMYRPQDFNLNYLYNMRFFQAKGIVFEALSTLGVLGTVTLLILILSFLSLVIYLLSREKEKNKLYSLALASVSIILILDLVSTRIEGPILILSALIGVLTLSIVFQESEMEDSFLKLSLKASPKFALALAFIFMVVSAGVVFLFVFLGKLYLADINAGLATRSGTSEQSLGKWMKAVNYNKQEGRYFTRIGQEYMVLANSEMLKAENQRDANKIRDYINNSVLYAQSGRDLVRNDVSVIESLAQIYENTGYYVSDSFKLAEENYKRALELEPNNPVYYLKLGQIKISLIAATKDETARKQLIEEARDLFQKSVDKKTNFDVGYYNLALVQEALKDMNGAVDSMNKALAYKPGDINYAFNLGRLYQERGGDEDIKIAEAIYLEILKAQPDEINTHYSLGYLYEKSNQKDKAIAEYQKVADLLTNENKEVKDRVNKMISNLKNGIENTPENLGITTPAAAPENTPESAQ
ncbi:MAG: hypothetical protein NTZ97_05165, partial [Candidatus Moranbacteria bacterium]|nr:hypothetical protein [Candidatus Moranbacteria bacterium]